jgi:hypothetical protein
VYARLFGCVNCCLSFATVVYVTCQLFTCLQIQRNIIVPNTLSWISFRLGEGLSDIFTKGLSTLVQFSHWRWYVPTFRLRAVLHREQDLNISWVAMCSSNRPRLTCSTTCKHVICWSMETIEVCNCSPILFSYTMYWSNTATLSNFFTFYRNMHGAVPASPSIDIYSLLLDPISSHRRLRGCLRRWERFRHFCGVKGSRSVGARLVRPWWCTADLEFN